MEMVLFALNAVFPVVSLCGLGYILKRVGLINPEFARVAGKLCFHVFLPTLLFLNIYKTESIGSLEWGLVAYACGGIIVLFALGLLTASIAVKDRRQKGVMVQCIFRSNFAMFGLPLSASLFGEAGAQMAAALSIFSIPLFNILSIWALAYFSGEAGTAPHTGKLIKEILKNPLTVGVLCGLLALCVRMALVQADISFRLDTLPFLYAGVEKVAELASPLALIVLGAQFEFSAVGALSRQITIATVMRLVIAPVLMLAVAYRYIPSFGGAHYAGLIALFGSPVSVASAIIAQQMHADGQLAGQVVVWTTLFSGLSIFCMVLVFKMLGVF